MCVCVHMCLCARMPRGLTPRTGVFHVPLSLEVGGGVLVSVPAQSRGKKKKNKSWFKKNQPGKTKSLLKAFLGHLCLSPRREARAVTSLRFS